ncbi:MAG TPA: hypothetical protein VHG09_07580 [Longimicrobiales bacterium]|nr:hypothetical protein [Longimicrobiales bacterium]
MFRKLMLTAAVTMLVLPGMASAQSTVTATATVSPAATVGGTGDLAFGTLSAGTDNVIDATSGATTRTLDYNHNVTISFTNVPAALVSGTSTPLPVALTCASSLAGTWSAVQPCSTASFDLDVGAALTQAILGFGGTIAAADVATAAAGDYAATFDITITAR